MKFTALSILLLFVTFLITPTIVSVLEKNVDTSVFYNFAEEEENASKLIKVFSNSQSTLGIINFQTNLKRLIISENLSKHDTISGSIFIPPPERV